MLAPWQCAPVPYPLDVPLAELRLRRSAKWTSFPPDVLPLPVAEMDVRLAPPIARALRAAVDLSDTGYAGDPTPVTGALARFARRRWGWAVDPGAVRLCADVAVGVTAVLRRVTRPGDAVVLTPPVYPPFAAWLAEVGVRQVDVPLLDAERGGGLDLPGLERALAAGARAVLLCSPHNPTGRVHPAAELAELAGLAEAYGAVVLADEIHAPLTLPGAAFTPYLSVSPAAARTGVAFHSASKAWNLAGLKCAAIITAEPGSGLLGEVPLELRWTVGHLGAVAAAAAYDEGEPWLDDLLAALSVNVGLLDGLLAERLPAVRFVAPAAGYLAWLDLRGLGLGDDPADVLLARGRVALGSGPTFGAGGAGFARLNVGCSEEVLAEAVRRMAVGLG